MNTRQLYLKVASFGLIGSLSLSGVTSVDLFAASESILKSPVYNLRELTNSSDAYDMQLQVHSDGTNPHVIINRGGEMVYKNSSGLTVRQKILEDYFTDSNGRKIDGKVARKKIDELFKTNLLGDSRTFEYTTIDISGEGTLIGNVDHRNADTTGRWTYEKSHSFRARLSTSGDFDVKLVKAKLGFDLEGTWTVTVSYTLDIMPGKAYRIYVKPCGVEYRWVYFETNPTFHQLGSGLYQKWGGTKIETEEYR